MIHENIPDKPDRNTEDHKRTLYAKQYHDGSEITIMSSGMDEFVSSDTWRENFR